MDDDSVDPRQDNDEPIDLGFECYKQTMDSRLLINSSNNDKHWSITNWCGWRKINRWADTIVVTNMIILLDDSWMVTPFFNIKLFLNWIRSSL